MEGWARDLRGWGRSSPSREALPGLGCGGLLLTHNGAMTGIYWVWAVGGLLVGFPMGALQHFLLRSAWVREHTEGPSPASSLKAAPSPCTTCLQQGQMEIRLGKPGGKLRPGKGKW